MNDPESAPHYLARCVDAFLEALREAEVLTLVGKVGPDLAEALRFAADLVDIIADGLEGRQGASAPLADVETLRRMLRSARGLVDGLGTLH